MLLLAHTGITLGAAHLLFNTALRAFSTPARRDTSPSPAGAERPTSNAAPETKWRSVMGRIDYRLVVIGSMLPDIIDKPVGSLLFRDIFSNGRIFAHTLVFSLALGLLGVYLYRRGKGTGALVLAFGSLMHLMLDSMWNTPQTLFWPLLGWDFPRVDLSNWLERLLYALRYNPFTFVPEIAGGLTIAWFGLRLATTRQVLPFLRYGTLATAAKPPSEPHGKRR